jgi:hypothetical protein
MYRDQNYQYKKLQGDTPVPKHPARAAYETDVANIVCYKFA